MNTDTAKLYDMIHVLVDGKTFYQEAAAKVTRPDLKRLFEQMAQTKAAIANDIKNKVVLAGGEPLEEGSATGGLRKAWAELRTKLSHDREAEYVTQLEEFEDRILESFREAVVDSKDPEVRAVAQKYMPEVTRDHNEMRALKQSFKA
jgi:uncharacterized protein (TIGR02284 family)